MIFLVIVLSVYGIVVTIGLVNSYSNYQGELAAKLDDRSYYESIIRHAQKTLDEERANNKASGDHLRKKLDSTRYSLECMKDDIASVLSRGGDDE